MSQCLYTTATLDKCVILPLQNFRKIYVEGSGPDTHAADKMPFCLRHEVPL